MDNCYIKTYIKCAWLLLHNYGDTERQFELFNKKYGKFLVGVIEHSQLSLTNLVIGLYYIYKYDKNTVNNLDQNEMNIVNYIIISSLVLSNKCYDDQSYTLKTWVNICNQQPKKPINLNLKLMNELESHFIHTLNFCLSFSNIGTDACFWDLLYSKLNNLLVSRAIVNKFRLQVTSEVPSGIYEYDYPSSTNSFASSPVVSPSISSNSIIYPLTPRTPASSKLEFGSHKKRKLNTLTHESFTFLPQSYMKFNLPTFEPLQPPYLGGSTYHYTSSFM